MTSKFDASYLNTYKTVEDNLYSSTGDYCGLTPPIPLDDRNSALPCPSETGYHDRRRHTGASHEGVRESRERGDHIGRSNNTNRSFVPDQNNDRRLGGDHQQTTNDPTRSSSSSTQPVISTRHRPRDVHEPSSTRPTSSSNYNAAVIVEQPRTDYPARHTPTAHDKSTDYPHPSRVNKGHTGSPVSTRNQERLAEKMDSNMNEVKGKHSILKLPEIEIIPDHDIAYNNQRPISVRIQELKLEDRATRPPTLSLAFPRPHSFDVPEKKSQVKRTFSAPDLLAASNAEEHCKDERNHHSGKGSHRHVRYEAQTQTCNNSKGNIRTKGPRSKSLPSVSLPRNFKLKSQTTRDTDPLRYFAYLGKRFQFRERLPSAHNILSARPVILTSTSVISPKVSTNFQDQLEDYDEPVMYQGTEDLIDCCTCMCCVKAVFYHCTKDDYTEGEVAAHPCACSKPVGQCIVRWSILGLFSVCMPCLLCYLPIQGCKHGVGHFRRKGSTEK